MKKLFLVIPLLFTLGACASLQTAWSVVTGVSVATIRMRLVEPIVTRVKRRLPSNWFG